MALCSGIVDDLQRRSPHYLSDWHYVDFDCSLKILSASFYMFFNSLAPAITFGMLLSDSTRYQMGVLEVLMATSIGGCAFSIFAGQPLVIVGVTGPITILTISMFELSKNWDIAFLPFYAWSQLFAALMHIFIAMFNLCDLIKHVTRFSCETFGVLIATVFIYEGVKGISGYFSNITVETMSGVYLQLIIALATIYLSLLLLGAPNWLFFTATARGTIKDYGVTLAVIFSSAIAYMGDNISVSIQKLVTPNSFGTTTPRSWLVDMGDLPVWAIFVSIIPGLIITILFAFDHNISSLMAQAPEYRLKKGSYFHYDFLVLGLCLVVTGKCVELIILYDHVISMNNIGVLGLPPVSGMIPHSFLHTKSLIRVTTTSQTLNVELVVRVVGDEEAVNNVDSTVVCDDQAAERSSHGEDDSLENEPDASSILPVNVPTDPARITHILHEQRLSNLAQSVLIGLMCFGPFIRYLQYIPRCVLDGLFVILGVLSFEGNQFFSRLVYVLCDGSCGRRYADNCECGFLHCLNYETVARFTAMQLLVCLAIFGVTFTPAVIIFPVLISVLVPLRLYVLPKYFDVNFLHTIDPLTESAEELVS
jgi:hypothetical protein